LNDASPLQRLLTIMRALRDPQGGCPWDLAQSFASLAPYTLEEACEVVDALERGDTHALRDELGDLLFQVVFLSQLAAEEGRFDFQAVAASIGDKLVRRHPHVFGEAPSDVHGSRAEVAGSWEAIKADERRARGQHGVLADVPRSLPALSRAAKLGRRAGGVGFDWAEASGARDKVLEEIRELEAAVGQGDPEAMAEELGDLLLAVTSWSRLLQLDPETCLRKANAKFEARFAAMESLAAMRGQALEGLSAADWDRLWNDAKAGIQS
jgi:nucleoside triphosphate diphosphatase